VKAKAAFLPGEMPLYEKQQAPQNKVENLKENP